MFGKKSPSPAVMWSHLVDDVESGRVLYTDALKDSRRSIEEIVPFKLLWKARKDPINSFHQFWRNDNHCRTKKNFKHTSDSLFPGRKTPGSRRKKRKYFQTNFGHWKGHISQFSAVQKQLYRWPGQQKFKEILKATSKWHLIRVRSSFVLLRTCQF